MPRLVSRRGRAEVYFLLIIVCVLLLPVAVSGQGNGRASTGTGGIHTIRGYVFFPSGRRAEGTIVVRLQPINGGEITVIPDSSGSFVFNSLSPGRYTVVVNAGEATGLVGEGDPATQAQRLVALGVGDAVVTLGPGGSVSAGTGAMLSLLFL